MKMDGTEQPEVARAKTFWMDVDVDHVFDELCEYLIQLRSAIKTCTATDREYVQGMNMITLLESGLRSAPAETNDSFVEVVIGGEMMSVSGPEAVSPKTPLPPLQIQPTSPSSIHFDGSVDPLSPSYVNKEDVASPILPLQLHYQPHDCSQACIPNLPRSAHYFRWHNPLKVPLHLSFQRQCAGPQAMKYRLESEWGESVDPESCDLAESGVTYQAPCGRSLHTPGEVLSFLLVTGSHSVLQMDYFSFNPKVQLDCPRPLSWRPVPMVPAERDLSRGVEPTPVELCIGEEGARPEEFRYRKERWPHGCFLSRGPLFKACCDCTDGCLDAQSCACIRMAYRGQHYLHQRLAEPVPTGIYECGPWCGCERSLCQNRVVQHGLRVRLQVFHTADKGWGVRCRDDLDRGTFVCTYAGVVLRACVDPDQPLPLKRPRAELPSDDEVEVVTEWLAPVEGRVCPEQLGPSAPTSPPLHVPVIQRPADSLQPDPDPLLLNGMVKAVVVGSQELGHSPTGLEDEEKVVQKMTQMHSEAVSKDPDMKDLKRETSSKTARPDLKQNPDQMYYLDATKDGNVGRFINHSCVPNLFVQNVFTDSHDPNFPMIAFFTNKVVKSGTELTWNYSLDAGSDPDKVPCLCVSDGCQGLIL
ncbi:histone-lysine N-methyltransferase SETDB2 isoform X1 [Osmerus eperlanus]|uniref:histone-lysine N-methyltransferase SETDB2 isoform X1 n=2 Tax=Osmerus eperlanus TaxID=29151 RepID=UPI002E1681C6